MKQNVHISALLRASVMFVILVLLVLSGCSRDVTKDELIGEYVANHDEGHDKLYLRADGTYTHEFTKEGDEGIVLKQDGRWKMVEDTARPE